MYVDGIKVISAFPMLKYLSASVEIPPLSSRSAEVSYQSQLNSGVHFVHENKCCAFWPSFLTV